MEKREGSLGWQTGGEESEIIKREFSKEFARRSTGGVIENLKWKMEKREGALVGDEPTCFSYSFTAICLTTIWW